MKHCSRIQFVHGAKMETSLSPLLLLLYDAIDILIKNLKLIQSCHYELDMVNKSRTIQKRLAAGCDFFKIASGSGTDLSKAKPLPCCSAASKSVTNFGLRGTLSLF